MNDDIELPPLPKMLHYTMSVKDEVEAYARAAVMADRQKREKPERKVRSMLIDCSGRTVEVKWDDKGAWIDSERNRELADALRTYPGRVCEEAADALDGGQ